MDRLRRWVIRGAVAVSAAAVVSVASANVGESPTDYVWGFDYVWGSSGYVEDNGGTSQPVPDAEANDREERDYVWG